MRGVSQDFLTNEFGIKKRLWTGVFPESRAEPLQDVSAASPTCRCGAGSLQEEQNLSLSQKKPSCPFRGGD